MKTIEQSYELTLPASGEEILKTIEKVARTCYASEDKICEGSAEKMVRSLIKRGHEAMLEHVSFTVRFIASRDFSHQLVRHRIASFAERSQRYCNFSSDKFGREITFIKPCFFPEDKSDPKWVFWVNSCEWAEASYFALINEGAKPEEARSVLPNSTATEIVMTANLREWRNVLRLRSAQDAAPAMRNIMTSLLSELKEKVPIIFDDI